MKVPSLFSHVLPGSSVLVAMSGGVDSSVAALLLKENGYKPVGVTMRYWVDPCSEKMSDKDIQGCCALEAVNDARAVAQDIGIPHYVLDMKNVFFEKVVSYFVGEYLNGRTPNPCVACNRYIKFNYMLTKAQALGIDYIATGHYARVLFHKTENRYRLMRGIDTQKDQSYALYVLNQEQLKRAVFPLGDLTKDIIRDIALKKGLKVAEKSESQEICFLPDNDYRGFLERERPEGIISGDILSTQGEKLGRHHGVAFYTIGQRRGLGISASKPLYVVEVNSENNTIIVGTEEKIYSRGLWAEDLNFISGVAPQKVEDIETKIRYRSPLVNATLYPPDNDTAKVLFSTRQKAVAPGQSAVFYKGDEVMGGGVISSAIYEED